MPFGTPTDPVSGTVITVAYASANLIDPILWLRQMTGGSDPPASNRVVVSTSTSATSWMQIPTDALADGAVTAVKVAANAVHQPALQNSVVSTAKIADQAVTSAKIAPGAAAVNLTASGIGTLVATAVAVGASGLSSAGPIIGDDAITADGAVTAGSYAGGSTSSGAPSFKGATIGTDGIVNNGPYAGGSTAAGVPAVKGLSVGTDGIDSAGPLSGPSLIVNGVTASATPAAGRIPVADASGLLDDWVTPAAFSIPSKLGFWVRQAADIPAGFTRDTSLDGLIPVGAGTTFSQTFTEGTSYGTSWQHQHSVPSLSVSVTSVTVSGSATGGPEDVTGGPIGVNGLATAGGVNLPQEDHTHSLNGVSFAVSASGTGSGSTSAGNTSDATWLPPMRAVIWIRKD